MEGIEFFVGSDGKVWFRENGTCETFVPEMKQLVDELYEIISLRYPEAKSALEEINSKSGLNKSFMRYKVVEGFVRCNMGNDDESYLDMDGGSVRLERVACPLRGVCRYEGVICRPTLRSVLTEAERKVAVLYAGGLTVDEIAGHLGKSASTVNNQLWQMKLRLGLKSRRGVARLVREYEGN